MQFSPSQWCTIILATAVLHKKCIVDNTSLPENVGFFVGDDDHEEVCHKTPCTSTGDKNDNIRLVPVPFCTFLILVTMKRRTYFAFLVSP